MAVFVMRQFTVGQRTFRFALHHTGSDAELESFLKDVEQIVWDLLDTGF